MYEIHVKHVSDCIIGKRNSPSESLFVRFQKEWPDLDQDQAVRSQDSLKKSLLKQSICLNNLFNILLYLTGKLVVNLQRLERKY